MAFEGGWNKVKLYFMLGLPTETEEDMKAIPELANDIAVRYYEIPKDQRNGKCQITISTSFFVPKPFTPFQWASMHDPEDYIARAKVVNDTVKEQLNRKSIKYNWHEADVTVLEGILARVEAGGLTVMRQPDFEANLQARMALYEEQGPITCFVGVGGNLTTTGPGEKDVGWGVIQPSKRMTEDKNSGLIQRYNARGLPVLHLLNVKRLVADYGLPYDPDRYETPGQSALYLVLPPVLSPYLSAEVRTCV